MLFNLILIFSISFNYFFLHVFNKTQRLSKILINYVSKTKRKYLMFFFYLLKLLKYVFKGNNIKMIVLILDFNFVIIIILCFNIPFYRNFCITRARRYLEYINEKFFREISFCNDLELIEKNKNLFYLFNV